MIELIKFTLYSAPSILGKSNELPCDVFNECVERWPQFKASGKSGFAVEAHKESSILKDVIQLIEKRTSKKPNWSRFPSVFDEFGVYQLAGIRQFERADIEQAYYFWCIPKKDIAKGGYRHDDDILEVERSSITAQPIGTTSNGFTVLCTETQREHIKLENFTNIEFKSVRIKGKKPPNEPLWELSGMKHLPPVMNKIVNDQGEKPDDSARGCWIDDLFFPPLLTYDQESLIKQIGSFDVSVTHERWHSGIITRRSPFLICSKRFKLWCQEHGMQFEWVPVYLEKAGECYA